MLLAILSLVFGLLALIGNNFSLVSLLAILGLSGLKVIVNPLIRLSPILGMVLGLYGLIRERRKMGERRDEVETMCLIGIIANAAPFLLSILGRLFKF